MSKSIEQKEYDKDFYAWSMQTADQIRRRQFTDIDITHLAEEVESMGKSEKRELVSRLAILIAHLLKWQFQPVIRSKSWMLTIKNQRFDISDLLESSPSLMREIAVQLEHAYKKALIIASEQTGIDENEFPKQCQFNLDQCLDFDFLPDKTSEV